MNDSLYRNSLFLFANNAILAATGFLFWVISARLFSASDVGLISTLIAAATFIASASLFGLDHTLIHYLAKHKTKASTIMNTAFSVATLGALLFSAGYLCIVPAIAPELEFVLSSGLWIGLFICLMLFATWNNILSSIFIASRITYFILIAGILFGIGRIILLYFFNEEGLTSLFNAHFVPFAMSTIAGIVGIYIAKRHIFAPRIGKEVVRLMHGYSLRTYSASLLASIPPLVLPLFVIGILGAAEAAYYNMPLLMTGLLAIIPMATSQSLFAEGAHGEGQLKNHLIKSVKLVYTLLIPSVILIICAGNLILTIFGANYAQHGYILLVFLALATLFKAGSFLLTAVLRILGDIKEIIIVTCIYVVFVLFSSFIALSITHRIWAVGAAILLSEILLIAAYTIVMRKKWPKIAALSSRKTEI